MAEIKRAPAALKVSALFFKAIINLVKSINVATRQTNKFNKLLKRWKKETKNERKRKGDRRQDRKA